MQDELRKWKRKATRLHLRMDHVVLIFTFFHPIDAVHQAETSGNVYQLQAKNAAQNSEAFSGGGEEAAIKVKTSAPLPEDRRVCIANVPHESFLYRRNQINT